MIPLRIFLAGAAVVLALGGGTALAAPALMASVSHGVSGAVQTCSERTGSARGACTSAAAQSGTTHSSSSQGQDDARSQGAEPRSDSKSSSSPNDAHGDAVSSAAKSCPHGTASDRDAHGDCVSAVARDTSSPAGRH